MIIKQAQDVKAGEKIDLSEGGRFETVAAVTFYRDGTLGIETGRGRNARLWSPIERKRYVAVR